MRAPILLAAIVGILALCLSTGLSRARLLAPHVSSLPANTVQAAFADRFPSHVLWAWQEPEDLRQIDPQTTGVAYLAETLRISDHLQASPRKQPLLLPAGARVMAVVRVEPQRGFRDTPQLRAETARRIAAAATSSVVALQVDFDATLSQRPFYADVLRQLRAQLPAGMPLSMTALLSWCSGDNWLTNLPVDEAVPMHFRLGLNVRDPLATGTSLSAEPKCRASAGVSMDESWPRIASGSRIYVFAPHPWTQSEWSRATSLEALATHALPATESSNRSNSGSTFNGGRR